jgi:hypothetical protein
MKWLGWLRRSTRHDNPQARRWREAWQQAAEAPDAAAARGLRHELERMANGSDGDELEIEREMLEGLDELVDLAGAIAAGDPPVVTTGHRAVGADRCYFSAPASLPDDPAQPSGTLLLTNTRMVFVGGARAVTLAWHMAGECVRQDRDVLLVRVDRQDVHRLRCNTYGDALRAAFLARHLAPRRRV